VPSMQSYDNGRVFAAELFGTTVLMLGGPGTAVLAGEQVGNVGVALGFGFSLLVLVYVIGRVSGAHVNPAVTLGALLARRITGTHALFAIAAQIIGSLLGAVIVYGIASGRDDFERGSFAANLWSGDFYGLGAAIVTEVVFTALLVIVVLSTGSKHFTPGVGGVAIGLTLALIHIVTIPVDNTSVNPVRSLATALFAESDTGALEQVWVFLLFPLVGAFAGVIVWLVIDDSRLEDTLLAEIPGAVEVRDTVEIGLGEAEMSIEDSLDGDDAPER
jgi:aquaporin Z